MAARLLLDQLIPKSKIQEEMVLIDGSNTDYITKSGQIYKDYGNNMFFHKKTYVNSYNGYVYCGITLDDGKNHNRRVHILLAKAFIPNPNNYSVVMHKDNNKTNNDLSNLQWGTISQNTQQAYDDGLQVNDKSWDDSQSIPVCQFDLNGNLIKTFGSIGECSREMKMTKTGILYQCNHNLKTKPRKGYYFRYLTEYEEKGFIL